MLGSTSYGQQANWIFRDKILIHMFVYFRFPRDEILVQTYLLVWLWINCPQTIYDNSEHAKKWKNQCLFVWLVYYEMCCMLMQWWFHTNMWCSFSSLWFGSGLGIINGQLIHDELKCQSMTAQFGQTNVWRGIHDAFSDRHGELSVTHFCLSVTKVNRHV